MSFCPLCRYAKSDRLRSLVNLVVVGGVIDPEDTGDREERDECVKMHSLIKEYKLQVWANAMAAWFIPGGRLHKEQPVCCNGGFELCSFAAGLVAHMYLTRRIELLDHGN